jgi:uncharacterized delta-60 repeat protein
MKINEDGSLNKNFGNGGILLDKIGDFSKNSMSSIAIQEDNKILCLARTIDNFADNLKVVLRYDANGNRDVSFGNEGMAVLSAIKKEFHANKIIIQPDKKIVLIGYSSSPKTGKNAFAIVRLNEDGSQDTGFGDNGFTLLDGIDNEDNYYARDAVIQKDGKIVVVGSAAAKRGIGPITKVKKPAFVAVRLESGYYPEM